MDREYLIKKMQKYLTKLSEIDGTDKSDKKKELYEQKFKYYFNLLGGGLDEIIDECIKQYDHPHYNYNTLLNNKTIFF